MATAVQLAALHGAAAADRALGKAAAAGRFADGDLAAILAHQAAAAGGEPSRAGEQASPGPGHRRVGAARRDGDSPMTLRRPDQDAIVTAADLATIRQLLVTCSDVLIWAGLHAWQLDYHYAVMDITAAAGHGHHRLPGWSATSTSRSTASTSPGRPGARQ